MTSPSMWKNSRDLPENLFEQNYNFPPPQRRDRSSRAFALHLSQDSVAWARCYSKWMSSSSNQCGGLFAPTVCQSQRQKWCKIKQKSMACTFYGVQKELSFHLQNDRWEEKFTFILCVSIFCIMRHLSYFKYQTERHSSFN